MSDRDLVHLELGLLKAFGREERLGIGRDVLERTQLLVAAVVVGGDEPEMLGLDHGARVVEVASDLEHLAQAPLGLGPRKLVS